jgi:uncharacterized membrane protein
MSDQRRSARYLDFIFRVGIALKGCDGVIEVFAGLGLLLVSHTAIENVVIFLTRHELIEDPHSFVANYLVGLSQTLRISTQRFGGIYLVGHGILKAFLVIGLLRKVLWVYPVAALVLALFVVYQTYRISVHHSLMLSALTVFDLGILLLIWWEYRRLQSVGPPRASSAAVD